MEKPVQVYLPDGYASSGLEYPVVYFIHSMSSNHLGDTEVVDAAEQLISEGWTYPFILVKPDAHCTPFVAGGYPEPVHSSFTNSELSGDFEDYFVEDLVGWVDATYRTLAGRDHRFVTGHSQGGYSAMRIALRHPGLFSKVGAHAAPLSYEPIASFAAVMIAPEYPDGPPYDYRPDAGSASKILFAYGASFTPNLTNPPWYVDLPFDEYAQPDPEVWPRFIAHSTTRWATDFVATGADLGLYFDCGTLDEMGANYLTQYFAGTLDALAVPYILRWFEGTHYSHVGIRMPTHLTFFLPLNAIADSPHRVFNPRRPWPQELMLELPGDLQAEVIDVDTVAITAIDGVELEDPLPPAAGHELGDVNGNGKQDLTVWFPNRPLAEAMQWVGFHAPGWVEITLRGETLDELFWEATESLFVPTTRTAVGAEPGSHD